ncbi:pilus assembly PilX family protein [Dyella sp. Tek66A03]|uniref:pilus assembly PilX family protein n=1 Tax=Dyella sp. Tek66A03 TaxID=3458298 RepID=UPI00403E99F3
MTGPSTQSHARRHRISTNVARQRGVALVVALILLVVISLVGFAAVRGTIMQQKMAANQYDRQIAFQSAEGALRAAKLRIASYPGDVARNCRTGATVCLSNPFNDPNLPANSIHDVAKGTADGQFTAAPVAASQPQYVIENMGNWADPTSDTGFSQNASSHNYGVSGGSTTAVYYRITARNGDPALIGNRAAVVLQAVIKQR